jgi:cytochrome c-type biogenesis protein CcmF
MLAHAGIGIAAIGIVATTAWQSEVVLAMKPGDRGEIAGYGFVFRGVAPSQGPNYQEQIGLVAVARTNGTPVTELTPSKRIYQAPQQATTEAAIHVSWFGDLYVVLGDGLADGAQVVRVYFNPLVRLIWLGALLMALGGVFSLSDRRLRVGAPRRARRRPMPAPAPAE